MESGGEFDVEVGTVDGDVLMVTFDEEVGTAESKTNDVGISVGAVVVSNSTTPLQTPVAVSSPLKSQVTARIASLEIEAEKELSSAAAMTPPPA